MDKTHQAFSKVIKSVAASEPHNLLQYFFFNYAQKEEELSALHQQTYADLLSETNETLESWSKKLILPMRVRPSPISLPLVYFINRVLLK